MDAINAGVKRFAKGFVAGGLAQLILVLGTGFSIHNLTDVKSMLVILATGFITGGILGAEKAINFQ